MAIERTFCQTLIYVRFTPESGPFSAMAFMSAFDPRWTFNLIELRPRDDDYWLSFNLNNLCAFW